MATESAKVTITGTPEKPVFNFVIPTGAKGERGVQGIVGPTPALKMGEVNTIANPSDTEWIAGMIRKSPVVTAALTETFPSTMKGEKGDKGDGGIPVGTIVADLDNYKSDGYFKMEAGADDIKNLPPNLVQKYGTLSVLTTNGVNRLEQIFYPTATSQGGKVFFIRSMAGNMWSAWRTIAYQRVDNTAGKAIYTWDDLSQREQLVYGDTGWRQFPASKFASNNTLKGRRIGGMCELQVLASNPTTITAPVESHAFQLLSEGEVPQFLRPTSNIYGTGFGRMGVNNRRQPVSFTLYTNGSLSIERDESRQSEGSTVNPNSSFYFSIVYSTTEPWPTVLPGAAIGIIPNL